jgi:hypothetical protein
MILARLPAISFGPSAATVPVALQIEPAQMIFQTATRQRAKMKFALAVKELVRA